MNYNRLSAIITGVSIVATTTKVIAQPVNAPKTEKEIVNQIQAVIEPPRTTPTQDDLAKAQIEQRLKEIAVQKQQEEERKRQEEEKALQARKTTRLAAQAAPASQVQTFNIEQWRPIIAKYPWPVEQAMLTMSLESHGNPRAVSRTNDHGLFQIHNGLQTYGEKIYDPEFNVSLAYHSYYKGRGWRPWYSVQGILW